MRSGAGRLPRWLAVGIGALMALGASAARAQPDVPPGHPPTGPAQQAEAPGPADQPAGDQPSGQEAAPGADDQNLPPGHPPLGPADVINRAREARQQADAPAVDQQMMQRAMGQGPPLAQQRASASVPAGTIHVTVVDASDQPVEGANVDVGVMAQGGGGRERHTGTTAADGTYDFERLATGTGQAYRVNVNYEGAKYSSTPFQLPPDMGYDVRIRRLSTTRDARVVMQYMGEVRFEFGEGRLKVVQIAVLLNPTADTYVFPEDGQEVLLPEGFLNFNSEDVMSDQHFEPTERGFRLRGSLPPGQQQLAWTYDLDLSGSDMSLTVPLPWRTMMYGVVAEAVEGMSLDVEGMPPAREQQIESGRVLMTRIERRPGDPPLTRVTVHLRGIPGPGPLRWIAFGAMLLLLAAGAMFMIRGGDPARARARARDARKQQLLDQAAALQRSLMRDEVGPGYHARQMSEIIGELAVLLRQERADKPRSGHSTRRS